MSSCMDYLKKKILDADKRSAPHSIYSHDGGGRNKVDLYKALTASKQIMKLSHCNYIFRGKFLSLMNEIDNKILEYARTLGAIEECYPTLITLSGAIKCGYVSALPYLTVYTGTVKDEKAEWLKASRHTSPVSDEISVPLDHMKMSTHIHAPAICVCT